MPPVKRYPTLIDLIMTNPFTSFMVKRVTGAMELTVRKEANGEIYSKSANAICEGDIVQRFQDMLKEIHEAIRRDQNNPTYS